MKDRTKGSREGYVRNMSLQWEEPTTQRELIEVEDMTN